MAEEKGSGGGFLEGNAILLVIGIIIFALFFSSGTTGFLQSDGIKTGSPSSVGTVEEQTRQSFFSIPPFAQTPAISQPGAPDASNESKYKNKIQLVATFSRATEVSSEYVDLYFFSLGSDERIIISNWALENSKGERFRLGESAHLVYAGQVNVEEPLAVTRSAIVHIVSGQSPIGTNFRTNMCTGYFNQFNNFTPRLFEECPRPEDENSAFGLPDACLDLLERQPRCRQILNVNAQTSLQCQNYINSEINYSKCVGNHQNDPNFFKNEWFVYLDRRSEIWKQNRETITLFDEFGKVITSVSYK